MFLRVALALLLAVTAGCSRAIDTTIQDATVTAGVKTALLNDASVDGTAVDVRTSAGVVYLSGSVSTEDEATRILSLVRGVAGVRTVESALSVGTRSEGSGSREQ